MVEGLPSAPWTFWHLAAYVPAASCAEGGGKTSGEEEELQAWYEFHAILLRAVPRRDTAKCAESVQSWGMGAT